MRILALVALVALAVAPTAHAGPPEAGPGWWTAFGSPELDGLVERAMARSADVVQAEALLKGARARSRTAVAALLPEVRAVAGGGWQSGPLINAAGGEGQLLNASLDARLDLDLSGGAIRTAKASRLDTAAQAQTLAAVRRRVQTHVVSAYARACELRLAESAADRAVQARRAALELQTGLVRAGLASSVDPATDAASADRRFAEQAQADVRLEKAGVEAELGGLVGAAPGELPVMACAAMSLPGPPADATSQLLDSQADVAAARLRAEAAARRLKSARLSWIPIIRLTASDGYASDELRTLFSGAAESLAVNALFSLPILDGGRRKASVSASEAEAEAADAAYRAALVGALWRASEGLLAREEADHRVERARTAQAEAAERLAVARHGASLGLVRRSVVLGREAEAAAAEIELAHAQAEAAGAAARMIALLDGGRRD